MTEFLEQGFFWLSLLGGVHCLGLALYLRYIYRAANGAHHLLAGIFALLSLSFFSGLLSRETVSLPMPLVYSLFIPGYFLLMPLLYHYCRRSLSDDEQMSPLHYLTAPLVAVWVGLDQWLEPGLMRAGEPGKLSLADYTPLAATLTVLLFLQTCIYYLLIFRLLAKHWSRSKRARAESLQDIRFRWLLTLCMALMLNWLVRVILTLVPVYFGDGVSELMLMLPRVVLLLSLYLLAFYGLNRITHAAYLRGRLALPPALAQKSSSQLLSADELNYLQELLQERPAPNSKTESENDLRR